MSEPLLEAENLTIQYQTDQGPLTAVSDVSFSIDPGEYYGLVGESGCGKTTLAEAVIGGLDGNGTIASGTVRYRGREIQDFSEEEYNEQIRWKEISWIPQGSMNSLDPLQRIDEQAVALAQVHTDLTEAEALEKFARMFDIVGIEESRITDYPHQFSGGMQQRAIIALALFLDSSLIIADEPTTALDVIMQDQIFKYLDRVKEELDTSLLLITHDISVVLETCDEMAIMHAGQLAESGSVVDVFDEARHPYSILLQRAFPDVRYPDRKLEVIQGVPPQSLGDVDYCTFSDRCPWAVPECEEAAPPLEAVDQGDDHRVGCIRHDEVYRLAEADAAGTPGSDAVGEQPSNATAESAEGGESR